jgi:uncharacterized repeat protein (TIGR03803 family)
MKRNQGFRVPAAVLVVCMAAIATHAQTFTVLASFDGTDGGTPYASLVQGLNGNFYGTTFSGGANGEGTVFEITPAGQLTTLYSFCSQTGCTDGSEPSAGLVQATNGNFYGTTYEGGANQSGTVFEIAPAGELTTLYSFCSETKCTDGSHPYATLLQATNGKFYGTTFSGGANGEGTVFEITPAGQLTTLYSFCSQTGCTDGSELFAGLVQATNGNFYGTTYGGGANGEGTVFEITPAGELTTLYSVCSQTNCTDGSHPFAAPVQATKGTFWGTTSGGGANNGGTVFEITSAGELATLYSFCAQANCADGERPQAGLVEGSNGNFYGTTFFGGTNPDGTVFEITLSGKLTTLYSFCSQANCADGFLPSAAPVQATNGNFYGTVSQGGANSDGTVFSLSVGLGPFVETLPTFGKVGSAVIIFGNALNGTTNVTFNGTATTFTVASSTEIKTTVPTGATSGKVQVTTPHGTLTSNVVFHVK